VAKRLKKLKWISTKQEGLKGSWVSSDGRYHIYKEFGIEPWAIYKGKDAIEGEYIGNEQFLSLAKERVKEDRRSYG